MNIVAISGSLRTGSSNAALLRIVQLLAPQRMQITIYEELGELPHFSPDLDADVGTSLHGELPPTVLALRRLLLEADGIIISTPEYAHGLPGSMKNVLDWLVSVGELVDIPVLVLNASPSGGSYAQASLLETLRTMNWNVLDASLLTPFVRRRLAADGDLDDAEAEAKLRASLEALAETVDAKPSGAKD